MLSAKHKLYCLRLAAYIDFEALQSLYLDNTTSDIIYNTAFGLCECASLPPELSIRLRAKKDFSDLCETQPEEIERLSYELGDSDEEIFSLMDEARQNKLICSVILDSIADKLPMPLLKLICEWLAPGMDSVLVKEHWAKVAAKALVAQQCSLSIFSNSIKFAERGIISYQCVMQKSFS